MERSFTRHWSLFATVLLFACSGARTTTSTPAAPAAAVPAPQEILALQGGDAVLWQHTSAEAYRLFQQGYELAALRLEANLAALAKERQEHGAAADTRPLAVIVDIDETVLDNSPYQVNAVRRGRTFDEADWKEWTDKAAAKALPGAVPFLQHARTLGCEVFYITNRAMNEKAGTLKNLNDLGFPYADEAHLLLMESTSDKTARRARVAATHRIVLLVGDQLRDFDERFKDRSVDHGRNVVDALSDSLSRYFVLLPNPMYGTYRDAVQGKGTDEEKLGRMRGFFERNGY